MIDENKKNKASSLVEKAKKKGLVKNYDEFIETKESEEYALSEEEIIYYTSKNEEKK